MRYVLSALVLAAIPAVANLSKKDPAEKDLAALQGQWCLKAVEWEGEETEQPHTADALDRAWSFYNSIPEVCEVPFDLQRNRTRLTIRGDTFVIRQAGSVTGKGTFRLDSAKKPAVMERSGMSYGSHCCNEGCILWRDQRRLYCIYSLDNNTLKWCFRDPRDPKTLPRDFITKGDDSLYVLIFHREKA